MQPSTPEWITPAQPGLITNGAPSSGSSSGGTFTPPLTIEYRSRGGPADGPVAARYRLTQNRLRGATLNPTVVYDSGWGRPATAATGATSPLPMSATLSARGVLWSQAVARVYVFDWSHNQVWSAPIAGLSVGSWRSENPPPNTWTVFGDPVLIAGQVFALSTSGIVQVPLNADGTLGAWIYAGVSGGPPGANGAPGAGTINASSGLCGLDFTNGQGGVLVLFSGGATAFWTYTVSGTTGTVSAYQGYGGGTAGNISALPIAWNGGAAFFDTSWWPGSTISGAAAGTVVVLHVIPGNSVNTYWTTVAVPGNTTYAAGTLIGPTWGTGLSLPTAVHNFGLAVTPQMLSGGRLNGPDYGKDEDIYVVGGYVGSSSTPNSTIYACSGAQFRSTSGAWATIQPSNWSARGNCGCATWPMPGANTGLPAFVIGTFGGFSDANQALPRLDVQTIFPGQLASGPPPTITGGLYPTLPNAVSGPGSVMPEATLQPGGKYLYSFTPHLPSQSKWGGPWDGDQYTLECDFVSQQSGDPSPAGLTTINFAKPPSITNVVPSGTIANGNPTVSFAYQSGAFGGPLLNWRVVITQGTTVIADSGLMGGDTTWTPGPAPCLTPGVTYGLTIAVNSTDSPLAPSDSASAVYLGTFTPAYAMPQPPYDLAVVQNTAIGAFTATWANPAGAAFNRVYYRVTGDPDPTWWLLQDSVQAQASMSLTLIDQLALGVTYDIAVTALDSTQSLESAVTVTVVNGDVENPGPPSALPAAAPVYTDGFEEGTTNAVLWRSLGTDALNTLDGWTLTSQPNHGGPTDTGGNTMYGNVLRQGAGGVAAAGHPDWQDGMLSVRFTIPAGGVTCWPYIGVHSNASGSSGVQFQWVPNGGSTGTLRLWVNSPQEGGQITPDSGTYTQTAGNSYWMTLTCAGHNYTGRLYNDSGGSIGTLIGTISGTAWATAVGAGPIILACWAGEVDWGGPYANVCTWSGAAPATWTRTVPSGTPASLSSAFTDTFANLSNWTQMTGTSATVASNVVSLPQHSGLYSNQTFTDGVWTCRFQTNSNPALTPWLYIRASGTPNTSSGWSYMPNGFIFQWSAYNANPAPLTLWKTVNGQGSMLAQSPQSVTVSASTWYWFRVIAKGSNVTVQMFSDSTGTMGSLIAEVTGFATDAVLQQGSLGIAAYWGAFAMGGAYSGVCVFQSVVAASGPGEPAFALSGWEAQAGQESVSIYQPPGQTLTANSGWARSPETAVVPVTQGDSYNFTCQLDSSAPTNAALTVEEYNASGTLIQSTLLQTVAPGLYWNPSITVTAAGSSGNYTNPARGTVLRESPSFYSTGIGAIQEGQPAIVLGWVVPDQEQAGFYWWPVAWSVNGLPVVAYLWSADAPGPFTTTRGGLQPQSYTLSGAIVPQATTAYLSVRPTVTGPGLHYFDQVVITAVPDVAPALFKSFGSDATGTLAAWTQTGGTEPAYWAAVLANSPVWWWPLDDGPGAVTVRDGSGNGLAGVVVYSSPSSGTLFSNDSGVTERISGPVTGDPYGFTFDGATGWLNQGSNFPFQGSNVWSLEVLFNMPSSAPINQAKGYYAPSGGPLICSNIDLTTFFNAFWFGFNTAGNIYASVGYSTYYTITGTTNYRDGNWHQAVVTSNGTTMTLYVDGASVGTVSPGSNAMPPLVMTGGPVFGTYPAGGANWYPGSLSNVSAYPTALSSGTVTTHRTAITGAGIAVTASIASNVVTLPQGAQIYAGHPDWTDTQTRLRFQAVSGSAFSLGLRFNPSTGNAGVQIAVVVAGSGIISFSVLDDTGTTLLTQNYAGTVGNWYWIQASIQGANANGALYADVGGAPGTAPLVSGSGVLQAGVAGLVAITATGTAVLGGAYPETFAVMPIFLPADWVMENAAGWTAYEPAFAWDATTAESGNYSLSIVEPPLGITDPNFSTSSSGYGFKSLGTDSTGTLTYWSAAQGTLPTIASNVATIANGSIMAAGHPDWADGTYTVRTIPGTSGDSELYCHLNKASGSLSLVRARVIVGTGISLDKDVSNTITNGIASASYAVVAGTAYWVQITAAGTTYTVTLFADNAGAIGSLLATCSGTITDSLCQIGQMGLGCEAGTSSQFGGAYTGVCTAQVQLPTGWTTSGFTTNEPAFALSAVNPYSGSFSGSIFFPTGAGGTQVAYFSQQPSVVAGQEYVLSAMVKTIGASTGAYLQELGNGSAPVTTTTVKNGAWAPANVMQQTTSASTSMQVRLGIEGPGTAYFDLVNFSNPNTGYWVTQNPGESTAIPVSPSTPYTFAGEMLGAALGPAYASAILNTPGLGSYYRLNDPLAAGTSIQDIGANGAAGTFSGSLAAQQASVLPNDYDSSIEFTGGQVTTGTQPAYGTVWSWECWYKTSAASGSTYWLLRWNGTAPELYLNPSNFLSFTPGTNTLNASTASADGKPHHAVVTYDGTSMRLYQDGVLVSGPTAPNPASPMNLGATTALIGNSFTSGNPGFVDEVAFYSVTLTAAQVLAHYQAGAVSYPATVMGLTPVSYYRLDETVAGNLYDYTGNGHTGAAGSTVVPNQTGLLTSDLDGAMTSIQTAGGLGNIVLPQPSISSAWTFSCWIKSTAAPTSNGYFLAVGQNTASKYPWIYVGTGGGFGYYDGTNRGSDTISVLDGKPHHLVVTYNGSNSVSLYRDGNLVSTVGASANASLATAQSLTLGQGMTAANSFVVDEISIHGVALTLTQVQALYAAGTAAQNTNDSESGYFEIIEWSAAGAQGATHLSSGPAGPGWSPVSASIITDATTAYLSVRALTLLALQVNFDNVSLTASPSADNQALGTQIVGPYGQTIFHVPGENGQTVLAVYFGTYMRSQQGGPQVNTEFDTTQIAGMGLTTPIVRYGVQQWRQVVTNAMFFTPTAMEAMLTLRQQAYEKGQPLVYRDTSGRQIVVMQSNQNHQSMHEPSNYQARQDISNVLWEVANTISPYTTAAYVLGKRALVHGSLPWLTPLEGI